MKEQNYKNHKRYLIGYHGITFILVLALFLASAYNLYVSFKKHFDIRISIMFFISSLTFIFLYIYTRGFALKAQDRAIRSEENLRYFMLTGKRIDNKINMSQILALRFAPDEEFIVLTKKAADNNLSAGEIKKEIKNWKQDHNRV